MICLAGLHALNICCLGLLYFVVALYFQFTNFDYEPHLTADGSTLIPDNMVLRDEWSGTGPYNAMIVIAGCSLGLTILDVLISAAEVARQVR